MTNEQPSNNPREREAQAPLQPLTFLRWLRNQDNIRGSVRAVLVALTGLVDNLTAASHPWHAITQERLARAAGFCARTVRRALLVLEAIGLVSRTRGRRLRTPDGWEVEPTRYQLHVPAEARQPTAKSSPRPTATPATPAAATPQGQATTAPQPLPAPAPPEPVPVRQPWSPWRRIQQGAAALLRLDEISASMADDLQRGALGVFAGKLTDEQRGRAMVATSMLRTKGLDLVREAVHLGLCYGPGTDRELEYVARDWAAKVVVGSTHCQTGSAMLGALRKFMRAKAEIRGAPEQAARLRLAQSP